VIQKAPNEEQNQMIPLQKNEIELSPPQSITELRERASVDQSWFSRHQKLFLGVFLGSVLTLMGNRFLTPSDVQKSAPSDAVTPSAPSAKQTVTVAPVEATSIDRTLDVTGTVNAFELIPVLSPAQNLQITQILVDEGQWVKQGQVLARLDTKVLQAQLSKAQATKASAEARLAELKAGARSEEIARAQERLNSAKASLIQAQSDLELVKKRVDRFQTLEAQGAIARDRLDEILTQAKVSQSNVEQAQARVAEAQQQVKELENGERPEIISQAQARVAEAQGDLELILARLKETQVFAPVSGLIAVRNAKMGNLSSSTQNLFEIMENGRLELQLNVPETQLAQVKVGQQVKITSNLDQNLNLIGEVRDIVPTVNENSRQATVKVNLGANSALKPGMFLQGSIITSAVKGLTIPTGAILPQSDGSAKVFVLQPDQTVKQVSVTLGEILPNNQMEIKAGINLGDQVIVKGAAYLKEGDLVSVASVK
jgi:HlyD family secretion protein